MYLLKILAHPGLTQEQMTTCDKFKAMMLSLNLQSMRLNAGDNKITSDEEVSAINSFYYLISSYFINFELTSACSRYPWISLAVPSVGGRTAAFE